MTLSARCAGLMWGTVAEGLQAAVQSGWWRCLRCGLHVRALWSSLTHASQTAEVKFYPSGELGAMSLKKSVQGKENVLFAHLPLFLVFSPSVNWCRQVALTVLCLETTLLSHLVQALVVICWLWRMKLKLLLPHPVSLFHLAMMP